MRLIALLLLLGLVAAGCGWKPPSSPQGPDTCKPTDGPAADTVANAIAGLPPVNGATWHENGRGHTKDCRLHWVQVSAASGSAAPQHVLFFDRNTFISTATPNPRPYTTVAMLGRDMVIVQYQWQQPTDQPDRPTGIAQVRFQLDPDGRMKALDPVPHP
jgi:hypothetical protein